MFNECYKTQAITDLLRTLHLSSQAEQQFMGDRVHQIEEGSIFVQYIVKRGTFQAQILQKKTRGIIKVKGNSKIKESYNQDSHCLPFQQENKKRNHSRNRCALCQGHCDSKWRDERSCFL